MAGNIVERLVSRLFQRHELFRHVAGPQRRFDRLAAIGEAKHVRSGRIRQHIATADGTATTADNDYVAQSLAAAFIPAGESITTFVVLVNGDTAVEPNETFFVNVTNIVNAMAGDAQGLGTIINDDADPCAGFSFPYTLSGANNAARVANLRQAIHCANANATADVIDGNVYRALRQLRSLLPREARLFAHLS